MPENPVERITVVLILLAATFGLLFFARDTISSFFTGLFSFFNPVMIAVAGGLALLIAWRLLGRDEDILLIAGSVLFVIGLFALLGSGNVVNKIVGNDNSYLCTGTVEVDLLGIGNPELDPVPVCVLQECSLFPAGNTDTASLFSPDAGVVQVVADGRVVGTSSYSSFGSNKDFGIQTSCLGDVSSLEVLLYEDGQLVDREVMI